MSIVTTQAFRTTDPNVLTGQTCDASVYVGAWVYVSSGVALNGLADDISTSRVIGVVERKPDTTTCDIRVSGFTSEMFTGLTDNTNYFLSATVAGEMSTNRPTTSGHTVIRLGKPLTSTVLKVNIDERVIRV